MGSLQLFFNELITELSENPDPKLVEMHKEGDQLLAIVVKSMITLRKKLPQSKIEN